MQTGHGGKRTGYADLEIPEYWRFDETGEFHGTRLAGDRLVEDRYEPTPIEEVSDGVLQGYSTVLNLYVRSERGDLRWHDPQTGQEIPTFQQERERRLAEEEAQVGRTGRQTGVRSPGPGAGGRTGTKGAPKE